MWHRDPFYCSCYDLHRYGYPVYLFYRRQRIECAEHGVHAEWIPWADGESRFTESFNNEVAWMALQMW